MPPEEWRPSSAPSWTGATSMSSDSRSTTSNISPGDTSALAHAPSALSDNSRSTTGNISPTDTTALSPRNDSTPPRGRTMERKLYQALAPEAFLRRPSGETAIDMNGDCISSRGDEGPHRLSSKDLSASPEGTWSTSNETSWGLALPTINPTTGTIDSPQTASATTSSSISRPGSAFRGHRDTFALIRFNRRISAPFLPSSFFANLLPYLDHTTYLSLRLTCRIWSNALRQPKMPAVYHLPTEIIQQIYSFVQLNADFDNARRTCKSWMGAGLDRKLLTRMLKRGGWWEAAELDLRRWREIPKEQRDEESEEWVLSKRLATEVRLGPDGRRQPMAIESVVDFSELGGGFTGEMRSTPMSLTSTPNIVAGSAVNFTVSGCGKFVLVAEGCVVYVYRLLHHSRATGKSGRSKPTLNAFTSIVCPKRVLAVSMDTTSKRYAIAALLDGRMGLVCDVQGSVEGEEMEQDLAALSSRRMQDRTVDSKASGMRIVAGSSAQGDPAASFNLPLRQAELNPPSDSLQNERLVTEVSGPHSDTMFLPSSDPHYDFPTGEDAHHYDYHHRGHSRSSQHHHRHRSHNTYHSNGTTSTPTTLLLNPTRGIPLEAGPRSVYRNLCSTDDPPRSVAICPQRRCVAFGCASGIELHWVDALTGQDLNRWFPLAAPSDFLYFLPPRRGVDSGKKLRLISSAAGIPAAAEDRGRWGARGMQRLFASLAGWPFQSASASVPSVGLGEERLRDREPGLLRTVDCDHYRAVPLSDGYHMLFTDPVSGKLCLGSDAPLGGPTKLLRKVVFQFQAPIVEGLDAGRKVSPGAYAAGADLRWGVRVVAAYGESIVLFCVPGDVFERLRRVTEGAGVMADSDLARDWFLPTGGAGDDLADGDNDDDSGVHPPSSANSRSTWPIKICGTELGKMRGLVDFAVYTSHGGVRVWAFSSRGEEVVWDLKGAATPPEERIVQRTLVQEDGSVVCVADEAGDVLMEDPPSILLGELREDDDSGHVAPTRGKIGHVSFDGAGSARARKGDLPMSMLMDIDEVSNLLEMERRNLVDNDDDSHNRRPDSPIPDEDVEVELDSPPPEYQTAAAAADESGGYALDLRIPHLNSRWSDGSGEEWLVDYLNGAGDDVLEVMGFGMMDCEIL